MEINLRSLDLKAYMYNKEDFRLSERDGVSSHGSDRIAARIDC